jgi:HD-GYP domain-containing protein (c-di-GMP phosphodiesterase class II)
MKTPETGVVIASDVLLEQLSKTIARHLMTPSSEVVLLTGSGHALAYHDSSKLIGRSKDGSFSIARMEELGSPVLAHLSQHLDMQPHKLDFSYNNRKWTGSVDKIARASGLDLNILMISPVDELLSQAIAIRWSSLLTTGLIMLISLPVVWLLANRISGPMRRLAVETDAIRQFDFDTPIETRSFISEVDSLANAMRMMKQTIKQFITMINSLAGEKDFDSLLERITRETMLVSQADAAVTYLIDDDETYLQAGAVHAENGQHDADTLPHIALNDPHPLNSALNDEQPALLTLGRDSDNKMKPLFELVDTERVALVSVPLRNRQNEAIGVLCLLYRQINEIPQGDHTTQIAFMRALSGFAAVSIESRHLLKMQEALLDAFIKLIAGAIDAKSPYTGGHCQRVPELTKMLAHAACESTEAPFDAYNLSSNEWDALHIASWLHDCGKVTTPEYVVDKATKLETIYDRIHEIRMRFELLKRDAQIHYWQQRSGGGDNTVLEKELQAELTRLDDDFAFIAECNEGGEFMAPERIERLRKIAETTWTRTLDDRIGISWEEKQRKQRAPAQPLPATEKLIDDKAEHIIERSPADYMPADNPWGFKLDVPEHKYNRGELYNLEVARGTLSAEERYKINDHMVQTITMLEKLPYPKHLRDVPAIAGGHHETMDGKGYPKRLTRDDMSLTARMMAIADIFEALTASDRPYKKAKTLNESIRILSFMRNDNHIDPDLFRLFLTSGVWRSYGDQFLAPEQIDEVDINQYLNTPANT